MFLRQGEQRLQRAVSGNRLDPGDQLRLRVVDEIANLAGHLTGEDFRSASRGLLQPTDLAMEQQQAASAQQQRRDSDEGQILEDVVSHVSYFDCCVVIS